MNTSSDIGEWFYGPNTPIGPIVGVQMDELTQTLFTLMALILVSAFFRIAFANIPAKFTYHRYLPESAMVILVGVILGIIVRLFTTSGKHTNFLLQFNEQVFFLFLIPPLILESGYFLHKDFFAKHISLILLYAVVGTFITSIAVGFALYIFGLTGLYLYNLSLLDCMLFGSLISSVDPVAVLAIFEDLQVNETLYMLVFGESVLNDVSSCDI
jgi:NhaP-type Na+/H+ or K+/H+ antiporter